MTNEIVDKERFAQLVRGRFPVNPVSGVGVGSENMNRLHAAMAEMTWKDPRFVAKAEAEKLGWKIKRNAKGVETLVRDTESGQIASVPLFNAKDVSGMPELTTMLDMSSEEFAGLQGLNAGLQVGPIRREQDKKQAAPSEPAVEAKAGLSGRFAVKAPYWLDGMHNVEGLALEKELNATLQKVGLDRDAAAMAKWMKENKKAVLFELTVVPVEQLLEDEHRRADLARPRKLLGGDLVRDKEGAYRPQAGGKAVLEDKGESLSVKGKSEQAYRAMIELAKAKGWTAIELTGNKAMLPDAWLEAKMQNLEVVNYTPTKEDQQRLAERMAKVALEPPKVEQTPEGVEARPGVAGVEQTKAATVKYTVISDEPEAASPEFADAKAAATCFAGIPAEKLPTVLRSEIGVDGKKTPGVMIAGTGYGETPGSFVKSADPDVDRDFADALAQNYSVKRSIALVEKTGQGAPSMYTGQILRIDGDKVVQKVGRDHGQVVYHDIGKLSCVPKVGEVADIRFGKDGIGQVAERGVGVQVG